MELTVRIIGDPVLRKIATEVDNIDENFKSITSEMLPLMYKTDGVGLAAPQIGISRRFFVMNDGKKERVVINPKILEFSKTEVKFDEGCLSIPDVFCGVYRPDAIRVSYTNLEGETITEDLTEYAARIFQHEFDHLQGTLFVDKISVIERAKNKKNINKHLKEGKKSGKELGEIKL